MNRFARRPSAQVHDITTRHPEVPTTIQEDLQDSFAHWRQRIDSQSTARRHSLPVSGANNSDNTNQPLKARSRSNAQIQARRAKQAIAYWETLLIDYNSERLLRLSPANRSQNARTHTLSVSASHVLYQSCARAGTTMPTLIQAAWALVWGAYCSSQDVCFSYTSSTRDLPLNEPTVSRIVRRIQIENSKSIRLFLREIQASYLEALSNQACSQEDFEAVIKPKIQGGHTSLIDIRYDLSTDSQGISRDSLEYDVVLRTILHEKQVIIQLMTDTQSIPESLALKMQSSFELALLGLTTPQSCPVGNISLLSSADATQIWQWNQHMPALMRGCVHQKVEEQVQSRPTAQAICSFDQDLTFAELDTIAGKLACHLTRQGVGPGVYVPLCFDKSTWAIVSMYAVLKAGGACVSVSSAYPPQRMAIIMGDLQPKVVLTSPQHHAIFETFGTNVISVDASIRTTCNALPPYSNPSTKYSDPAFVVYTSGSTGKPKGVVVSHGAMVTSAHSHGPAFGLGHHSRAVQFASYIFDASIQDIFTSLQLGGTVCVISEEERLDDLGKAIEARKANFAELTPTVARLLQPSDAPSLQYMSVGGEALNQAIVDQWAPHVRLLNTWGPSEASIDASCSAPLHAGDSPTNIGRAVGCRLWIADPYDSNKLMPIGAVGEILIQGHILADGYLHDHTKTSQAFIRDPRFALDFEPGETRMYKTGDLAFYTADGSIEFIGRKDFQVKLRGQRFELGDVEHNLALCAPQAQAVVADIFTPDVSRPETKTLVAFIQYDNTGGSAMNCCMSEMNAELQSAFADIQKRLQDALPIYMVPTLLIPCSQMPLTASGKLSRKHLIEHLQDMDASQLHQYSLVSDGQSREISDAKEINLREAWSEVLGIESELIGPDDHFLRHGGNSLAAMRLASYVRQHGLQLTVAQIFQHPILSDMASITTVPHPGTKQAIIQPFAMCKTSKSEIAALCELKEAMIEDAYPCTALQEGLLAVTLHQPFAYTAREVFVISDDMDIARLREAWSIVAKGFPILRTRIVQPASGELLQVVVKQDIEWHEATSLEEHMAKDRTHPMSYNMPLWRFALIEEPRTKYMMWTSHHSGYDGWLESSVLENLKIAYETGTCSAPQPFQDFIRHVEEIDHEASKKYWEVYLSGSMPAVFPQLPYRGYVPQTSLKISQTVKFAVPRYADILSSAFLRAAWGLTMSLYCDSEDVIFVSTLAGRQVPVPRIEDIAGPTITTVPVKINASKEQTIADYLLLVHNQQLASIPHEHYGLQRIRQISPEARQAMDLQSLFLVQPSPPGADPDAEAIGLNRLADEDHMFDAYALNVQCFLDGESTVVEATVDTNVLSQQQIEQVIQQFSHIIQVIGEAAPETLIKDIPLISESDYGQMRKWNGPYPPAVERCLHDLIEDQMKRAPDSEAICSFDGNMTYAELDAEATRLAHYLVSLGVTLEEPVCLCLDKGRLTIVAMLAVLKAGAICVSLGATQPKSRLEELSADLGSKVVLVSPQHAHLFTGIISNVISIGEALWTSLPRLDMSIKPCPTARPDTAAFIVYTSGSTGKPKGIVLEHQQIATSAEGNGSLLGINPGTRVLQFASFLYDVSIQDVFTTLSRGATVCVISEDERFNDLSGAINRTSATWVDMTSTVAGLLDPVKVPTLNTLSLGGEAMKPEVANKWETREGVEVFNSYGPAECSVTCACSSIAQRKEDPSNIGTPVACWLWVVDPSDHHRLRPIGTIGELLVEGPLLAREYFHDKVKTAAAFLTGLKWAENTAADGDKPRRFYATGDLVKLQVDGTLVYRGRADKQVKINGQRVELGEIESNLATATNETMKVAVDLIASHDGRSRKQLAAFLQPVDLSKDASERASAIENITDVAREMVARVHQTLKTLIPAHMIPALYFPVSKLPTNPSGKLDRNALHALVKPLTSEEFELYAPPYASVREPETQAEYTLRDVWCTILRLPPSRIGADSNFFGVGGDSIAAMQLVSRCRAENLLLTVDQVFRYPTLGSMAAVASKSASRSKDQVSVEPFALCQHIDLQQILTSAEIQSGVSRSSITDAFPSTRIQEALFSLTALQEDAYVSRSVFRIPDNMSIEQFKSAWQIVFTTHTILRTRLCLDSQTNRYMQVVYDEELSWLSSASLNEYIVGDRRRGFHAGSPLTRFGIVFESGINHFIWTLHHALYDGWTLPMLFGDFTKAYNGQSNLQHIDYRPIIAYLESQSQVEQEEFWQTQLGEESSTSWPQPPKNSGKQPVRSSETQVFESSLVKRDGILPASLIRAAWALTVSQYAASDDVVMASTLSGRDIPVVRATEVTLPLLCTIPLRVKIDRSLTIPQYLDQIQRQAVDVIPYQHFGLQNIQALQKRRGMPLDLQHLLIVQPKDTQFSEDNRLGLEEMDSYQGDFNSYPLNIEVALGDEEIEVQAVYDANCLSQPVMKRILTQFIHNARSLAKANPDIKIMELNSINATDRDWMNDLNRDIPTRIEQCVHYLVEQQTRLRPNAEAIRSFDGDYSYQQLNDLADKLAGKLVASGVKAGSMVPLCFDKSAFAIISMLATLKAGGACVSISAAYPRDRLQLIIEDTDARIVLASPQHVQLFDGIHAINASITVFGIDKAFISACTPTSAASKSNVQHTDPSFVVYTSGSTGRPKGVVVSHSSMVSSAAAHGAAYGHGPTTRAVQFASYTFDASIQDIFTSLQRGGCVCVISEEERLNDLANAVNRRGANYADLTPTVASLLSPEEVPGLETLSLGGEILTEKVIQMWLNHGTRLLNTYGPTECSINSTYAPILSSDFSVGNIGKPLGCVLWVTEPDDHNKLVPVGCQGELLIEGPILATEYLNDPTKTKAAFVSSLAWLPQDEKNQARRMYKTGDLVKYRDDGGVEYLGRKDQQVKINGLRIELGEIESQIALATSDVDSAAVDVVQPQSRNGSKSLAAFVRFKSRTNDRSSTILPLDENLIDTFNKIKDHLSNTIPSYMVPSLYFAIVDMPTSASGKLDRRRLKALVDDLNAEDLLAASLINETMQAPTTDMEITLQGLWSQILRIDQSKVAASSHFFRVGGDSIRAMQLATLARTRDINLTVAQIFRNPQLSEQAEIAQQIDHTQVPSTSYKSFDLYEGKQVELERVAADCGLSLSEVVDVLPATPLQEGLISITSRQPEAYVAQLAYKIPPNIDVTRLKKAWLHLTSLLDIMRTRLVISDTGNTLQIITKEYTAFSQATSLSQELKRHQEFKISYGRALAESAIVEDEESGSAFFLLTAHHASYDGWSINLLFDMLEKLYQHEPSGNVIQFPEFVHHICANQPLDAATFWRQRLQNASAMSWPPLPGSKSSGEKQTISKRITFEPLSNEGHTSSVLLRTAWTVALSVQCDSPDVIFAETLSGRDVSMPEAMNCVGPMLTTVPTRIVIEPSMSVADFLDQVQNQSVEMIAYQHTGLQNIKLLLDDPSTLPELQIGFITQPQAEREDMIEVLGLESLSVNGGDFDTFVLNATCNLTDDGVILDLSFDTSVLSHDTIQKLATRLEHAVRLLSSNNKEQTLGQLDMLIPSDLEIIEQSRSHIPSWLSDMIPDATSYWIVDVDDHDRLLPPGVSGRIIVETGTEHSTVSPLSDAHAIEQPRWRGRFGGSVHGTFYLTEEMGVYHEELTIKRLGPCQEHKNARARMALKHILNQRDMSVADPRTASSRSAIDPTGQSLQQVVSRVLNLPVDRIDMNLPFASLGGDSISAMRLVAQCRTAGVTISVPLVLTAKSLHALARAAATTQKATTTNSKVTDQDVATVLSPIQRWFFQQAYQADPAMERHYNQSFLGRLKQRVSVEQIAKALDTIAHTHPMLRAVFVQAQNGWSQQAGKGKNNYTFHATQIESLDQISRQINGIQCSGVSLERGIMFSANLFELTSGEQYVFLLAHHLVVDIVSWSIILDDFEQILTNGPSVDPETTSFLVWAQLLHRKFSATAVSNGIGLSQTHKEIKSFWGLHPNISLTGRDATSRTIIVDRGLTELLLGSANTSLRTEPLDLLIAVISHAFLKIFPERNFVAITNEGHGREPWSNDIDLSRTVGWFTTMSQLTVSKQDDQDPVGLARQIKDQRRKLVRNGLDSFSTRMLSAERSLNGDNALPNEILLNYSGQKQQFEGQDSLLEAVDLPGNSYPADQGRDIPIDALFDIGVAVSHGCLEVSFDYATKINHQARIGEWIEQIPASVRHLSSALIEANHVWTSSDFPLLHVDNDGLKKLVAVLEELPGYRPDNVEDIYPCTPIQDGMLISQAREPSSYRTESTYELAIGSSGTPVDVSALANAWRMVVARHSTLRTVFVDAVSEGVAHDQVVLKSVNPEVIILEAETQAQAMDKLDALLHTTYSNSKPPHRVSMCRVQDDVVIFRIEASHAITDGASGNILIDDLIRAYSTGTVAPLPAVYKNFFEVLQETSMEEKLHYWTTTLEGAQPTLFPHLSTNVSHSETENLSVLLPKKLVQSLGDFCVAQGVTLASVCEVAWALVLTLYTGKEDVCFGYLASGRDAPVPEIENAIGAFVNMLVCRVKPRENTSIADLVSQVHNQSVTAFEHQNVPLADIQHKLNTGGQPFFNTIMSLQRSSGTADQAASGDLLIFNEIETKDPTEYDIAVDISVDDDSIGLSLDFNSICLSQIQAERVLSTLQNALDCIANDHTKTLSQVNFLSQADAQAIVRWNGDYPTTVQNLIHEAVEAQVLQNEDTPAIISYDKNLSYSELDRFANRIAAHLYSIGVRPGDKIPLAFHKTSWAAVAQFGVLKADCACVPINPEQPVERIKTILQDIGAKHILVSAQHSAIFDNMGCSVIPIDASTVQDMTASQSTPSASKPSDTAFIIYTSGSTGTPKGVVLSHQALATSAQAHGSAMSIGPGTRVLQYAAYTFDVSIQDIWTTLQRGGTTIVVSDDERLNTDKLINAISTRQANWADLTPTVAALIDPSRVPTLRTISLGGEAVPQDVVSAWESAGRRVINGYGPAEASINAACSDAEQRHGVSTNIGRPLASWFWITKPDHPDCLMPVGTVGELLIESPQLADCYLNDSVKTSNAFITDLAWTRQMPSIGAPSSRRMYRTGDLVRLTEEGTYIYIGRADRQVKIRGQRVELGEIEHYVKAAVPSQIGVAVEVVKSFARKERFAVVAFFDMNVEGGEQTLVLQPDDRIRMLLSNARKAASESLPRHMVPTMYIPLYKFPINASGKLDRSRLHRILDEAESTEINGLVMPAYTKNPPRTGMERAIQQIWCEVLSVSSAEIGLDDHFMSLGGDSIVAMQLVKAARLADIQLSVKDVLQHPKLIDMAHLVESRQGNLNDFPSPVSAIDYTPFSLLDIEGDPDAFIQGTVFQQCPLAANDNIADIHPITDFQQMSLENMLTPQRNMLNYFTYTGKTQPDIFRLNKAVIATVAKFATMRSAFVEWEGKLLQVVLKHRPFISIKLFSTHRTLEDFMDDLMGLDMDSSLSFGEPIAQFALVQHKATEGDGEEYTLALRINHAQYDGTSMSRRLAYLAAVYDQDFVRAEHLTKDNLTGAHFMHLLTQHNKDESYTYWRSLLQGASMPKIASKTNLSTVFGSLKRTNTGFGLPGKPRIFRRRVHLPTTRKSSLHTTTSTIVRVAWAQVLATITKTDDILFGALVQGRNNFPDSEYVMGACVNYIPVRLHPTKSKPLSTLLHEASTQSANSIPHENIGFKEIATHCCSTWWSPEQFFTSCVVHQNLPEEVADADLMLGDIKMHENVFSKGAEPARVIVETFEEHDEEEGNVLGLNFTVVAEDLQRDFAEEMLGLFCGNIEKIFEQVGNVNGEMNGQVNGQVNGV